MRIRAAIFYEAGKPLQVEEVELDPPQAGEVLVRLVATGVCHSDVHYFTGDAVLPSSRPTILGHEGAGVVEAVGTGVSAVAPGDHVILSFLPACGSCKWCHLGEPTLCDNGALVLNGRMLDGTARHHRARDGKDLDNFLFVSSFGEYTITREASLVKVPNHLPLDRLCLLGCGFTTGFGAATNAAHIRPGESVTIVGCGGLGLSAIQGARASDAGKIIAVDIHEEKLALAKHFGATHTVLNRHDIKAVVEEIRQITWGEGTDHSFEFVGTEAAQETQAIAFKAARKLGTVYLVGAGVQKLAKKTLPISSDELILYRKKIQGVLYGDSRYKVDIPRYVSLYEQKKIDLDGLITKEFQLDDINTCFQNILAGNKVARQIIRYT